MKRLAALPATAWKLHKFTAYKINATTNWKNIFK